MAYYYAVQVTTGADGVTTATVPPGTSWVGQPFTDSTYLIKTITPIPPAQLQGVEILPARLAKECQKRGLVSDEILNRWGIGGNT